MSWQRRADFEGKCPKQECGQAIPSQMVRGLNDIPTFKQVIKSRLYQ